MPARSSRLLLASTLVSVITLAACGGDASSSGAAGTASGAPAANTPEHFESRNGKFSIEFPGVWRGGYRAVEHADTSAGSRFAVEFVFKPDPAWKVEPRPLLVVRIFPRAAWEKVVARPGDPIATKVAERGDDVFAYSVPGGNPYRPGTPAAGRFDELVLSVVSELRLTPR